MTAESGLPQEAVACTCLSPADGGEAPAFDCPLHGDPSYLLAWVKHQADGLAGALAAERAKVAALQQAVNKVRALHTPTTYRASWDEDRTICSTCRYDDGLDDYTWPCPTVALLPDVQADDRGTEYGEFVFGTVPVVATPTPATTCADCGTTRTLCDAGLNTYDTRCCGQCGHREGK